MNKTILKGRIVRNAEIKYTQSGKAVASFTLAVNRRYKPLTQNAPTADFFNCYLWDKAAESLGDYLIKGKEVCVEGRMENNNYTDRNGVKHYAMRMVVEALDFCGKKNDVATDNTNSNASTSSSSASGNSAAQKNFGKEVPPDEQVPF